nr:NAD(P)H-binding protein [Rubrivivax benzoatilyticus]
MASATGLVGREIDRRWAGPGPLVRLTRRPLPARAGRVNVRVPDFLAAAAFAALPPAETAFCALGTTRAAAGSDTAFRAVDLDAVLAFARAARAAGVRRFALVSALGADAASSNLYLRTKGEAEAAIEALGFETLVVARPSLLLGDRGTLGQPPRPGEALAQHLSRPLAGWIPARWRPVAAADVAAALLHTMAAPAPGLHRLESAALQPGRPVPR